MQQSADRWLLKARQFDEHALTEIYQALSPGLYRYAYRLLGDARDAEDAVAESFRRFLQALRQGGGPSDHLMAYMYRIAHNLITDRYRRQPLPEMPLDERQTAGAESDPEQLVPEHLTQDRARALLLRLTPDQRLVIALKYFEGLSNEEVSRVLDKPVGAVKSLQHRALSALRRMLTPELAEEVL